jgi:hypothetical protein
LANSEALCWKGIGGLGDDDPGDKISDGADPCEDDHERGDDADEVEVPAVVKSEAGADSGDHAVVAWAGELAGVGVRANWRRGSCGDGSSTG